MTYRSHCIGTLPSVKIAQRWRLRAPVPVIRQLAERLEMHRLHSGKPEKGPIFANGKGNPLALGSLGSRVILPTLNRCEVCGKAESERKKPDQKNMDTPTSATTVFPSGMAGTRRDADSGAISIGWECLTWSFSGYCGTRT